MAGRKRESPNIGMKIEPSVVAIIHIALAYLLKWALPLPYAVPVSLRNAGFGMVVVGFFLGVAALVEFRKARTTSSARGAATALVSGGIYKFTRHPIYLGFLFMVIGLPLNGNTYYGLLLSPLFVIALNRLVIAREEAALESRFGKAYTDYKATVRRWL